MGQEQDVPRTRQAEAELRTTASPDEAYAAWADPAGIAAWFVDAARGEAVAGGTMIWEWKDFGIEVPYRVLEADPGWRLVLAGPENVAPAGMIEITITRDGGTTVLRVVNSGFLDEAVWDDVFEDTRLGWIGALALLQQYLERG
ncbi:MAG TPA: SRPBCC domain-containing protein, partial [Longimicrobiales bacterium]|nr:SRPBCC domain-containing protein [Longimicrobiales bacterium]